MTTAKKKKIQHAAFSCQSSFGWQHPSLFPLMMALSGRNGTCTWPLGNFKYSHSNSSVQQWFAQETLEHAYSSVQVIEFCSPSPRAHYLPDRHHQTLYTLIHNHYNNCQECSCCPNFAHFIFHTGWLDYRVNLSLKFSRQKPCTVQAQKWPSSK